MKITLINNHFLNSDSLSTSNLAKKGIALTIGNFDGLHLGHQEMINTTITVAQEQNLLSAVMVFEPMPKEFFSSNEAPARLMNRFETEYIFSNYKYKGKGIDYLLIADFNDKFRSLSAQDFAEMLIHKLNVKSVVLGDDFRFGFDRSGDSQFLIESGLSVKTLNTVTDLTHKGKRISSTRIRELLAIGSINEANQLLGRDYCMIGHVRHGDKIGRTLNFPTANIELNRLQPALHGVFSVDVQILDNASNVIPDPWHNLAVDGLTGMVGLEQHSLFGTANVGTRPAVNGKEWRLEVHFPNFKGDLYGKQLKVRFLHFLHGERRYNGLNELKSGIQQDVKELIQWRAQVVNNINQGT